MAGIITCFLVVFNTEYVTLGHASASVLNPRLSYSCISDFQAMYGFNITECKVIGDFL
jgi:hypothetical protein